MTNWLSSPEEYPSDYYNSYRNQDYGPGVIPADDISDSNPQQNDSDDYCTTGGAPVRRHQSDRGFN